MKVTDVYNVGVSPSSLAIDEHEKYAYVCNSNNYGLPNSDNVTVLNLKDHIVKKTIYHSSFNEPYRIAINHCGTKAYVTNSGSPSVINTLGTVSIIDLKTNTVEGTITGFDGPTGILLTKKKMYVTNYGAQGGLGSGNGKTISVVDLETNNIIHTITTDLAPAALSISPCRKYIYCLNYTTGLPGTGTINVISRKTNNIIHTITGLFGPFGFVVNKNNIAYVTNFGSNNFSPYGTTVSVVDMNKKIITKEIEIGIQPAGICLSKCENYVYVSTYNALYASPNTYENLTYGESCISFIDTKCNKIISPTIKVGQTASTLVSSENKIYLTNYSLNIVQTIEL